MEKITESKFGKFKGFELANSKMIKGGGITGAGDDYVGDVHFYYTSDLSTTGYPTYYMGVTVDQPGPS